MFVYTEVFRTRQKFQQMPPSDLHNAQQEISDAYAKFRTYVVVGSLGNTTNFGHTLSYYNSGY